jgi:hypothetical protein
MQPFLLLLLLLLLRTVISIRFYSHRFSLSSPLLSTFLYGVCVALLSPSSLTLPVSCCEYDALPWLSFVRSAWNISMAVVSLPWRVCSHAYIQL